MPRLDNARLATWRDLAAVVGEVTRGVDEDLMAEWDIPLGWYEVLAALQRCGGRARPLAVAQSLRIPVSTVSRRLDRLEDEGWVARHRGIDPDDGRAVEIELTGRGRTLWRAMHVSYRRSVQQRFAVHLGDQEIAEIRHLVDLLNQTGGAGGGVVGGGVVGGGGGGGYPVDGPEDPESKDRESNDPGPVLGVSSDPGSGP
jgi:DNA-binding MarR family transcriptional regulator